MCHPVRRAMGESNAVRVRRPLMRPATARRAAEIYAEKFGTKDGTLPATYQARGRLLPTRALSS